MTELEVTPVIFETQELFDLDIALQAGGYKVIGSYSYSGMRTKHYFHPTTLNKPTVSENVNENLIDV